MSDYTCRWHGCERDASDEPISVFCSNHVKVMRPYEAP